MKFCFGTETEFALVVDVEGEVRPAPQELAHAVIEEMVTNCKYATAIRLPKPFFLANGACIYADIGGHPEIATAEVTNPSDLLAQTIALRRMIAEAAENISKLYGISVKVVANNTDYAMGGAHSFGYHLNVLVTGLKREEAVSQISPLLAAMPIIAGTGCVSFDTKTAGFELSQRARFMSSLEGKHTMANRAMVTVKDEPLCSNGTRLHLICLDTPRSPLQIFLVPAIIVLVLKAAEAGDIAGPVCLSDPVESLLTVSRDPSLKARLPLSDNVRTVTAIDIHKHYIGAVSQFLSKVEAPQWVTQTLKLWQEIVSNLRRAPYREHRLDWVVKLLIFDKIMEKYKLTFANYEKWIFVLASVRRLQASWPDLDPLRLTKSRSMRAGIRNSALGVLDKHLADNGLSWTEFGRVWQLSNELCRQCLRYHTLTTSVNFDGVSQLVTPADVERAVNFPPNGTRAHVRGEAIRNGLNITAADWNFVQTDKQRLVLNDAFGQGASWEDLKTNIAKENN